MGGMEEFCAWMNQWVTEYPVASCSKIYSLQLGTADRHHTQPPFLFFQTHTIGYPTTKEKLRVRQSTGRTEGWLS